MKKIVLAVFFLLILVFVGFLALRFGGNRNKRKAVLKVETTPQSTIFLGSENIGKTPFEDEVDSGEYTLKLVPDSTAESLVSWEGNIKLSSGLLTYVQRDLGSSDFTSAGEVIMLEKISDSNTEIAIVTVPDAAAVTIDGQDKGKSPLLVQDISPGNYELSVSQHGYLPRSIKIKATKGYKLNAVFDLSSTSDITVSPEPSDSEEEEEEEESETESSPKPSAKSSPKPSPKKDSSETPDEPYVEILDTPTDFLNVREKPTTTEDNIITKIYPGDTYPFIEEENGWYKIEYEDGEEGWISGQYADLFE